MKHLLITGTPGVGKTTIIREVAQRMKGKNPVGFITEEIRVKGQRQGFPLVSLDGRSGLLSHVHHQGLYRVGRYRVNISEFEKFLSELDLCHSVSRLVLLDETGKMECLSKQFTKETEALLNSSKLVFATVALKGEGFIKQVKERPDCRLIFVTRENRGRLINSVASELEEYFGTLEE